MSGLWAARGGATSAAAQDWLGPKADAARLMAADDGEDFREALITPVFQELAYVSAQRLNPWFQPWMYTKATDFMLDVVDGLEEGFAASSEGLVCLATGILLRYLGAHAIDSSKLEVTANLCLTIASKFNERMYVPLSRGAKHDVIEPSTGTVVARSALELEVLDRLGWRLNVVTPYALKRAALEAVLEQHELDATPEIYAQCWCAPRLHAWPPQYPPSTLGDCARNFSGAIFLSVRRLPPRLAASASTCTCTSRSATASTSPSATRAPPSPPPPTWRCRRRSASRAAAPTPPSPTCASGSA
jgi:hypothetical protein